MKVTLEEIIVFLKEETFEKEITSNSDIWGDCGVSGDDFHELLGNYQKRFEGDMNNYLWYFHGDEEGSSGIGAIFFKPPQQRVTRIPITPVMLMDFANSKKWDIKYPEHTLPKRRYDLLINTILICLMAAFLIGALIKKYLL
jgi:hypothetical protein